MTVQVLPPSDDVAPILFHPARGQSLCRLDMQSGPVSGAGEIHYAVRAVYRLNGMSRDEIVKGRWRARNLRDTR